MRLPGSPELGYGLTGYGGQITIVRFNLMLIEAVRQLEASGKYPPGEDDTTVLAAAHVLQGGLPNTGETVEWKLRASHYDRKMVHDLLRRWGLDPREVQRRALGRAGGATKARTASGSGD